MATENFRANATATCENCRWFLNNSHNGTFAWCDPFFRNHIKECFPEENTSEKECYSPCKQ